MSFFLIILYGYFFLTAILTYFIYRDQKNPKVVLGRYRPLAWTILVSLWSGVILGLCARFIFPYQLTIATQEIKLNNIKTSVSIAFVTDIQVGNHKKTAWVEKIVEKIISINPDLVLLGGDLIDNSATFEDESQYLEPFKKIAEKYPIYYILGNHEYGIGNATKENIDWTTGDRSAELIKKMNELGIPGLRNQLICPIIKEQTLCIFGMDDIWSKTPNYEELKKINNYQPDTPLIMLTHNPDGILFWPETKKQPDLVLAGHTHGGQIWLPLLGPVAKAGVMLGDRYYQGLNYWNNIPVFTSVGAGESAVSMRFIVVPEIALIKLNPAN